MPDGNPLPLHDHKVVARELKDLYKALAHSFTQSSVDAWLKVSATRPRVFKDTFFGCIRWPKSIGNSVAGSLASGFSLALRNHFVLYQVGPGGEIIEKDGWMDMPTPLMWDGEDDADHYRVNFGGTYAQSSLYVTGNELTVSIVGSWTNRFPERFLLPNPLGYIFGSYDGHVIVLDPITVDQHLLGPVPLWSVKR